MTEICSLYSNKTGKHIVLFSFTTLIGLIVPNAPQRLSINQPLLLLTHKDLLSHRFKILIASCTLFNEFFIFFSFLLLFLKRLGGQEIWMLFFLCFIHESLSWESFRDLIEGCRDLCFLTNRISLSFLLKFSYLSFKLGFKRFLNKLVCLFCCLHLYLLSLKSVLQINELTLLRPSCMIKVSFILL